MQYSPYSATMNPYQTIYNNGGAAAYQATWGYTDLFGHMLGTNPDLPLGYTRQQYNEERALAAESMWKSPLLGLGTFGIGTVASYALWGSPFQDLANKVGGARGAAAFNVGFSGTPNNATIFRAQRNLTSALENLKTGVTQFKSGDITLNELRNLSSNAMEARATLNYTTDAVASRKTLWGAMGRVSGAINDFKSNIAGLTEGVFNKVSSGVGTAFETVVSKTGGLVEGQINRMTGNVVSPWLEKTGTSLFNMTENGWMAKSLDRASRIAKLEDKAAKLFKAAEAVGDVAEAGKLVRGAEVLTRRAETLRGGVFGGLKRSIASSAKTIGTVLKSGKGISGLIGAGGKAVLTTGLGFAGGIAAQFLNPATALEMYLIDQAVEYGTDTYQNYQTENEIKRNLMAKGSRILQYGFADGARGLQAGFSSSQRNQIVSKIRDMATIGAGRGDVFGLGADSFFGGHHKYSERLRELKSILNVGTDMGFFDMSKSMDDFEKKFEQTVKTVDKLSKMLKRTKGEIMTVMANVQNTEGLYNMNSINASVLKKDFAARLSGVDLTTAMQESAAGAQMGRQAGFSAAMGANLMSDSRILMSNAIRSGDLSREDIFRLGGEQGVVTNLQQGYLNAMNDDVVQAELAMGMVRDPRTGKMKFDESRLRRLATASDEELRKMSKERFAFMNTTSYSRIRHASFKGGRMYDAMRYLKTALANGEVSQDQYNMAITGAVRQKMLAYHMDENSAQYQETLRLELENLTGDPTTANILAKQMLGGYAGMQAHNRLAVTADRAREAYEKSGIGLWGMGVSMFKADLGRNAALGAAGFVGGGMNLYTAAGAFAAGSGESIFTAIGGYIANRFDPTSDYARRSRERVASAMQKYGYDYEHVLQFMTGNKTDLEIISSMRPGEFRDKLRYLSSHNMLGKTAEDTAYEQYESGLFSRMNTAARKMSGTEMRNMNKWLDYLNRRTGYDQKNTIGGFLNFNPQFLNKTALREMGITEEEAAALDKARERLLNGGTVDLTKMKNVDIEKFGRIFMTGLGKANLTRTEKEDILGRIIIDSNGKTELQNRIERASLESGNNSVAFNTWYSVYGGDSFRSNESRKFGNLMMEGNSKTFTNNVWGHLADKGSAADTAGTVAAWAGGSAVIGGIFLPGVGHAAGALIGAGIGTVAGIIHSYSANKEVMTELEKMSSKAKAAFGALNEKQISEIEKALDPSSALSTQDRARILAQYQGTFSEAFKEGSEFLEDYNAIMAGKGIKSTRLSTVVKAAYLGDFKDSVKRVYGKIKADLKKDISTDDGNLADEMTYYLVSKLDTEAKEEDIKEVIGEKALTKFKDIGAIGTIDTLLKETAVNEKVNAWLNEDIKKELKSIQSRVQAKTMTEEEALKQTQEILAEAKYADIEGTKYGSSSKTGDGSAISDKAMASFEHGTVVLREVITRLGY